MHTEPIPTVVTAEITLNLVIGTEYGMPVPARFSYSAHQPLSVTASSGGEAPSSGCSPGTSWQEGTKRPVGDGTLRAGRPRSLGNGVCIALCARRQVKPSWKPQRPDRGIP